MKELLKSTARRALPVSTRRWLKARLDGANYHPPVGSVQFGNLRRVTPISRVFGYDRGLPVDRYYIEGFLARNLSDVRGHALEVGDNTYTRRFGGDRVTRSDVVHVTEGNPNATIVADMSRADNIRSNTFDCIIFTQTLHFIYDVRAAVQTLNRVLKPGGVALVTFPGISQIDYNEWREYWLWSFTALSARKLFAEAFPAANVGIETHGNVLAATAFLQGLAAEELTQEELDYRDLSYPVIITVRAVKSGAA